MEKVIHKRKYKTVFKDPAPGWKSTTLCGEIVEDDSAKFLWKDVTCEKCLESKVVYNRKSKEDKTRW